MPTAVELLVRDAELLVVDDAREIPGGWVAVDGGRVTAVGAAGTEPEARTTLSAAGRLVTPAGRAHRPRPHRPPHAGDGLTTGGRCGRHARRPVHSGPVRAHARSHSPRRR
ncbi:hypothetical protein [Streptomyces sp. NBC_01538]|uniref:hypothetical protein n=1 Tax=Streptomyces sp. NBC_01538 TaxID=2903897 RepID=UPI0038673F5F